MYPRLLAPVLLALALTASFHVTVAAKPLYVVCALPDGSDLFIVVENFGGVGGAVQQCVHGWRGRARGIVN